MIQLSNEYFMFFEPQLPATVPIIDALTEKASAIMSKVVECDRERGWYSCVCGTECGSILYITLGKRTTHPLVVHYIECHRSEIPDSELVKLEEEYQAYQKTIPKIAYL